MNTPNENTSLADWLHYLELLHPTEIDLGLERVKTVADELGVLKPSHKVITVAGTNGKGSVCAMLDSILRAGGYNVACYTSPHLIDYNERFRINGEFATDDQIIEQFNRIEKARGETSLSYFEFATLAALLLFNEAEIDVAILEVGLGGRLDAVNIIDADCSIVTSIDVDHTEYLGSDRNQIAWEKAHIYRSGKPAICADPQPPITLIDYAKAIGADLWIFGKDFNYSGDNQQWAYGGRSQRRNALSYPALRGANQLINASAAMAALESIRPDIVIPAHAIRLGLLHAVLPGRFQILPGDPIIILDVAHNPHSASALGHNLAAMPSVGKTHAVVGMFKDKDNVHTLLPLVEHVDNWYCASLSGTRGLTSKELSEQLKKAQQLASNGNSCTANDSTGYSNEHANTKGNSPGVKPGVRARSVKGNVKINEYNTVIQAFKAARKNSAANDRILVFGSFSSVGPVLELINSQ